MKKYIHLFLFCSVILGTIYINYNLLEIKTVQATKIKKVNYTEQIPVSGLFENKNSHSTSSDCFFTISNVMAFLI